MTNHYLCIQTPKGYDSCCTVGCVFTERGPEQDIDGIPHLALRSEDMDIFCQEVLRFPNRLEPLPIELLPKSHFIKMTEDEYERFIIAFACDAKDTYPPGEALLTESTFIGAFLLELLHKYGSTLDTD